MDFAAFFAAVFFAAAFTPVFTAAFFATRFAGAVFRGLGPVPRLRDCGPGDR